MNTKNKKTNTEDFIPYCVCCGTKKQIDFYASKNIINKLTNRLHICKMCVDKKYNEYFSKYGDSKIAIYYTCRKFDLPYSISAFNGAKNNAIKTGWTLLQSYFKEINSGMGKANNYGTCFDESLDFLDNQQKSDIPSVTLSDFEVSEYDVKFWGSNFSQDEYEYLSEKLGEYLSKYECETPAMEELLQQAAFESLEIRNKRQRREDVSKNLKNLQDLLGSANIKPNQESGANATDQTTYSTLLKKWENEEPLPEPDEEWKDVDGIGRYIRIWFLGHLCKMMGITNDYSKEYEEEMEKLRVSRPSDQINPDEMDEGD